MADNAINTSNILQNDEPSADHSSENLSSSGNVNCLEDQNYELKPSQTVHDTFTATFEQVNMTSSALAQEIERAIIDLNSVDLPDTNGCGDSNTVANSASARSDDILTTNELESQISTITTDNTQQRLQARKHIFISYKHGAAADTCRKIHDRLVSNNYDVWFDENNFTHGRIYRALGNAIDNAYVVLLCVNTDYAKSNFCLDEAIYARYSECPIIPCKMEKDFQASCDLGIILSDWKSIDFFDHDKFENSFKELRSQIDAIKANSDLATIVPTDEINFRFNAILIEHMLTVRRLFDRRINHNEAELWEFVRRLIQEFSPGTWQSFENDQNNDATNREPQEGDNTRLLQYLFRNNESLLRQLHENHASIEQYTADRNERSVNIQNSQQELMNTQHDSEEHLMPMVNTRSTDQQTEEQNDRIIERIQQDIMDLKQLIVNQQEQHAQDMESLRQSMTQTAEASSNRTTQQQSMFGFNVGSLTNLLQTIVLLCTLLVLFKTVHQ